MNTPPLKPTAVQTAAREIRQARYLSVTVSDEDLVRKTVSAYLEAARPARRPRPRPRQGARA